MSADHKRPLYAFVIVAVLCALIIGDELRSQAATISHVLSAGAAHVIPGMTDDHQLAEAPVLHRPEPLVPAATPAATPAPARTSAPAAPVPSPTSPSVARVPSATAAAHPRPQRHAATHVSHRTARGAGHVFGDRPGAAVRDVVHAVVGAAGLSTSRHPEHPEHPEHRLLGSRPGRGHGLALGLVHRAGGRGHHAEARTSLGHPGRPGMVGPGRGHAQGHAQGHAEGHARDHHARSHGWARSHHGGHASSHARTHARGRGHSHAHGRGHARGHGHR